MAYYLFRPTYCEVRYPYEPLKETVDFQFHRLLSDGDIDALVTALTREAQSITDDVNKKRVELYGKLTPYHPAKRAPVIRWENWRGDTSVRMLTIDGIPAAYGHYVAGKGLNIPDED